jgi:hypothetical protein
MSKFEINPEWLRYSVESSQIKEIAFDIETATLFVIFWNKSIYSYPFTFEKFEEFRKAQSIGKYFYANVRGLITKKERNGN